MDAVLLCLPTLAHVLIGFFFVFFGVWNSYHWAPTVGAMRQMNMPLPSALLAFGIFIQIACGLLIFFGIYVKVAALILIPFVIIVVNIFHAFWKFEGEIRRLNLLCYVTHMTSTIGGLILLINIIEPNHSLFDLLVR